MVCWTSEARTNNVLYNRYSIACVPPGTFFIISSLFRCAANSSKCDPSSKWPWHAVPCNKSNPARLPSPSTSTSAQLERVQEGCAGHERQNGEQLQYTKASSTLLKSSAPIPLIDIIKYHQSDTIKFPQIIATFVLDHSATHLTVVGMLRTWLCLTRHRSSEFISQLQFATPLRVQETTPSW